MSQQPFSIYLLKEGFNHSNAINKSYENKLKKLNNNEWKSLDLSDASLFLQISNPKPPIWKTYFGITEDINNQLQGAILFLPIKVIKSDSTEYYRYFAITFGHSYHAISRKSIDHNFGLITTLNALDPKQSIRSIDTVFPENEKRERIQSPKFTSLSFFNFNKYESLVKSLQGKVKKEYKEIFNNITGTVSFKCTSSKSLNELEDLCRKLFDIYSKKDYEKNFPELTYIKPELDPDKIDSLNKSLILAIQNKAGNVSLSIPEILDPFIQLTFEYHGIYDIPKECSDVLFDYYYDYVIESNLKISQIELDDLYNHNIVCKNIEGKKDIIGCYSIYDCIVFDTTDSDNNTYHLCDGNWYKINRDYILQLKNELDPVFIDTHRVLGDYDHQNEGDYNSAMGANSDTICLDKKNISPEGQTNIEPCDLITLEDEKDTKNKIINLIHIKIDTKSSSLSHLFNQGLNSISLIRSNSESKDKLIEMIETKIGFLEAIQSNKYNVVYGIVTRKEPSKKSDNLPLFSRISLSRVLEQYKLYGINCNVIFIKRK